MYQPLVACDACRRHVRASDALCPFCRHSRTPDTSLEPSPVLRLSRAAAFALMAGIAGCHSEPAAISPDPVGKIPPTDAAPQPADAASQPTDAGLVDDPGGPAAEYGAPPVPKPPKPGPIHVPAYGGPPAPPPKPTTKPTEF